MSNEEVYIPKKAIEEVALGKGSESALALSIAENDGLPNLTMNDIEDGYTTLKGARVALGLGHLVYVRRLVKEGKLEGIKIRVGGGTRWLVTRESISAYKVRKVRRGTKRNYTLRLDPKDEEAVRSFLASRELEYELELTYATKAKKTKRTTEVWAKVIGSLE